MATTELLTKRMAISKANAQMVIIVGAAAFVTIFCLIAAKAVWSQNSYQARVISAQNKAIDQLKSNLGIFNNLSNQYNTFVSNPTNILGGQSSGTGNNGGTNSKIILDALPPIYDFPSLASSMQNLLSAQGNQVSGLGGTDNELSEQNNNSSPNPTSVSMPFSFTVNGLNFQTAGNLLNTLNESVRPISIDSLNVTGGASSISVSIQAHTYYQPAKTLGITQEDIK